MCSNNFSFSISCLVRGFIYVLNTASLNELEMFSRLFTLIVPFKVVNLLKLQCLCVCVCVRAHARARVPVRAHLRKSEDGLQESICSFHRTGPRIELKWEGLTASAFAH
jgi:hypothetical protein